jgi:hypothetical protein
MDVYETPSNSEETQAGYQALNEEVAQITTSISRLWGGFRKQARRCPSLGIPADTHAPRRE